MSTENSADLPITHSACKASPFGKGVKVKHFNSPTILQPREGSGGLATHLGTHCVPGSVPGMGGHGGEMYKVLRAIGPLPWERQTSTVPNQQGQAPVSTNEEWQQRARRIQQGAKAVLPGRTMGNSTE